MMPVALCARNHKLRRGKGAFHYTIPPDAPKDSVITQQVETQLAEDRSGDLDGIVVATEGGTVTLTGTVPKAERKARAAELARQVKGVKRVKNDLEIRPDLSR